LQIWRAILCWKDFSLTRVPAPSREKLNVVDKSSNLCIKTGAKAISPLTSNAKNSHNGRLYRTAKRGRRRNWWIFDWLRI
jgi:hypothetical protein